jgi:hypothetical protein
VRTFQGIVLTAKQTPVSGALIQFSEHEQVWYTNAEGRFNIPLDYQPKTLFVKAPGLIPQSISLEYNYGEKLTIYLNPILPATFNADSIITKAIGKRLMNETQYTSFTTNFYKKNKGYIKRVPFALPVLSGKYVPEKSDTGMVYFSERYARLTFKNRNRFKEEIIGQQQAGFLMVMDWNYAGDFDLSLHHDKIYFRKITQRGYYSPIGSVGKSYYQYTALGTYMEQGRKVYLIGFSPQRPYEAVMQGFLALYDSTYQVAYAEYNMSPETQLEFVDSIHVKQHYGFVNDRYTMHNQSIAYRIDLLGYAGTYQIDLFYDSLLYTSPHLLEIPDSEVQQLTKQAVFEDSLRWQKYRPVVLDPLEARVLKDQNTNPLLRWEFPAHDSDLFEQFQWRTHEILYSKYYRRFKHYGVELDPLYFALGYNTVEGAYLRYDVPITFYRPNGNLTFTPELRYGFADNRLKWRLSSSWFYDLLEPNQFDLEFGHVVSQINEDEPLLPIINSVYTLFLGNNYLKLFQKDYAKLSHKWEIINGFDINLSAEYAYRTPLFNRSFFTITGNEDDFTPNNINHPPESYSNGFTPHHALTAELGLFYRFQQLYKVVHGRKYNLKVLTPEVYFNWKKGLQTDWSETNFDFISGGIGFVTQVGNIGVSKFDLSGGGFVNAHKVPFVDFKHFDGVQTFFLQPVEDRSARIKQFSTLPYYAYSTNNAFIEAHFEHDFEGFLFSKSRYLRYTNIHGVVGFNYLHNFTDPQFIELFIGLNNIFHALKIEFAGSLDNTGTFNPALRFGVDFDYLHYRNNRSMF